MANKIKWVLSENKNGILVVETQQDLEHLDHILIAEGKRNPGKHFVQGKKFPCTAYFITNNNELYHVFPDGTVIIDKDTIK